MLTKGNISWAVGLVDQTKNTFRLEEEFAGNILAMLGFNDHLLVSRGMGILLLAAILIFGAYVLRIVEKLNANKALSDMICRFSAAGIIFFVVLGVAYVYFIDYFTAIETHFIYCLCKYVYQFVISVPSFILLFAVELSGIAGRMVLI